MRYGYVMAVVKASVYGNPQFSGRNAFRDAAGLAREVYDMLPYRSAENRAALREEDRAVALFKRLASSLTAGEIASEYDRMRADIEESARRRLEAEGRDAVLRDLAGEAVGAG